MLRFFENADTAEKLTPTKFLSQSASKESSLKIIAPSSQEEAEANTKNFLKGHFQSIARKDASYHFKKIEQKSQTPQSIEKIKYIPEAVAVSPLAVQAIRRRNKPYTGWLLNLQGDGRWVIKNTAKNEFFYPTPTVCYIFVTMLDGSIRIGLRADNGHAQVSQFAEHVQYAGAIWFDAHQKIIQWNNDSRTYAPPASLQHQAGLTGADSQFSDHDSPRSSPPTTASVPSSDSDSSAEESSPDAMNRSLSSPVMSLGSSTTPLT